MKNKLHIILGENLMLALILMMLKGLFMEQTHPDFGFLENIWTIYTLKSTEASKTISHSILGNA